MTEQRTERKSLVKRAESDGGRAVHADEEACEAARDARLAEWDPVIRALTLDDLAALTEADLRAVPYFGSRCMAEVKATLAHYGLASAG